MTRAAFHVTDHWRRWIAENYLIGTDPAAIVGVLERQGLSHEDAEGELARIRDDAYLVPAGWLAQRLRKLESMLDAQRRMRDLVPGRREVPRCTGLTREEFLARFYGANLPVVLTDVAQRWPARDRWTPAYLGGLLRDELVEVMTGRESDDRYEEHLQSHRTVVSFADYVADVEGAGDTNDFYLVANNHFLERPAAARLLADIELDERFLDATAPASQVFFWYGPAGTVTPLHHDTSNVLLCQVRGRKRVTLVPALESHLVYNDVAVYSPVDPEAPDLMRYPRYADATVLTVTLAAGEALFIPVGWWHHVRSLDISISVSCTAFCFPNYFDWAFPKIERW
jgi:ribosomal protein L16 Arg81 hydroxylase